MKIIEFYTPTCQPCRRIREDVLPALKADGHKVEAINAEEHGDLCDSLGIHAVPTLILLRDDGAEAGRITGATNLARVRKAIAEAGQ